MDPAEHDEKHDVDNVVLSLCVCLCLVAAAQRRQAASDCVGTVSGVDLAIHLVYELAHPEERILTLLTLSLLVGRDLRSYVGIPLAGFASTRIRGVIPQVTLALASGLRCHLGGDGIGLG
ncbi:hypothetical protein [Cryobacterium sp. MP_3.1]|uniref:hypothetical protein n=1 Tax=Cryobacterium sp. MP_3.1 TaxID=3071711 RepID=UPI002E13387D